MPPMTSFKESESSTSQQMKINVSGHLYTTTQDTLLRHPNTKLGRLARQYLNQTHQPQPEIYFDADDDVFREILRYYRTGELHVPSNMCYKPFKSELDFWEIDEEEVSECCQAVGGREDEMEAEFLKFEESVKPDVNVDDMGVRHHIWYFMADPTGPYTKYRRASIMYTVFYLLFVVVYCILTALTTVPEIAQKELQVNLEHSLQLYNNSCYFVEVAVIRRSESQQWKVQVTMMIILHTEVAIRFIACPKKLCFLKSENCLTLIISILEVIYLVIAAVVSRKDLADGLINCDLLMAVGSILYVVSNLRLLKILRIALYMRRMQILCLAMWTSRMEVFLLALVLAISAVIGGPVIYLMDTYGSLLQNQTVTLKITSIPQAYWLVIVTMTTVGYGDATPSSVLGCLGTAVFMTFGLVLTALPVAIIGSNFTLYYNYSLKRDKRKRLSHRTQSTRYHVSYTLDMDL